MAAMLEVCVDGIENARRAVAGGADRIELCADLAVGGITPSAGAIAAAVRLGRPVQVLVRPRGGDFRPTRWERAAMLHDIRAARRREASGVVLGLLRADGRIDAARMAPMIEAAGPLGVTFHKAFDLCPDVLEALETLIGLGIERVLTSGGAPTAREGLVRLADLHRAARGRIAILAGGRIRRADIPALKAAGLNEIHVGSAAIDGDRVHPDRVRALVAAVRGAGSA